MKSPTQRSTPLVERIRWLKYILPPVIAVVVVVYQLLIARVLHDEYGHFIHYAVEIAFYSFLGPVVTWITLTWIEKKLIEKEALEKQIQARNQQIASLTNASTDAIVSLDVQGKISSWNRGAENILGYSSEEIIGKSLNTVLQDVESFDDLFSGNGQVQSLEALAIAQEGHLVNVDLTATQLKDPEDTDIPVSLLIMRDITARLEREAILEEERARISRDLHDGVAQTLFFLALKSDAAYEKLVSENELLADEQKGMGVETRRIIRDIRRTIFALEPLNWEVEGFFPTLRSFIKRFAEQMELVITINIAKELKTLPRRLESVVFRVVQESLNNIAKHSSARNVKIQLELDDNNPAVLMTISDDGVGLNSSDSEAKGFGLDQMQKRVESIAGEFRIESNANNGTKVTARLPFHRESNAKN